MRCGKGHKSTDKKCNVFLYNTELKRVTAENNISLKEAVGVVNMDKTKELPRRTYLRSWPEISKENNPTFEDKIQDG